MKRWIPLGILLIFLAAALGLCCSAVAPEDFSGEWYFAEDASLYTFRDGIVECAGHSIPTADGSTFSGAYSFARKRIALFCVGPDGVGEVRELSLVRRWDGDRLCGKENGTTKAFFYRSREAALRNLETAE